jgi:hypothetical protein
MKELTVLVQSQLRRLWRGKAALLVALLGPIVILILAGYAFSGSYGLRIGAYQPKQSDLAGQLTHSLETNGADVRMFGSEQDCMNAVRSGDRQACLLFSESFAVGQNNTLTLVLDGSNLALTGILSDGLFGSIQNQSFAVSTSLARQMASALDTISTRAKDGKATIVKLTTTQDSALKLVQGSGQSVSALDVTLVGPAATIDQLNATNAAFANSTLPPLNATRMALILAQDRLTNLSARINATLNMSNITADMRQTLQNLSGSITNISIALQAAVDTTVGLNTTLQGTTTSLSTSLASLVDQLAQTRDKLVAVGTTRASLSTNLNAATTALNDALVQVAALQQTLDSIEGAVSGISVTNPALIGKPLDLVVRPLAGASRLASVFPALLVLVVAFGALLLAPRLVHVEREAGAVVRLSLILTSPEIHAIATACTGVLIVAAQSAVLVLLSLILFSGIIAAPVSTFVVALVIGAIFMLLGCALAYLFSSEEASLLAALSLGILLFLVSGSIIPVERTAFTSYNPLLLATDLVRQTALFGVSYLDAAGSLWLLLELLIAAALCYGALLIGQQHIMDRMLKPGKK